MALYHITTRWTEDELVAEPRRPHSAVAIGEDNETPRISAAHEIRECLLGITLLKLPKRARVYRTVGRPVHADYETPMKRVPDWEVTNEVWLTGPTRFKFVGEIEVETSIMDNTIRWRWARPRARWQTIDIDEACKDTAYAS